MRKPPQTVWVVCDSYGMPVDVDMVRSFVLHRSGGKPAHYYLLNTKEWRAVQEALTRRASEGQVTCAECLYWQPDPKAPTTMRKCVKLSHGVVTVCMRAQDGCDKGAKNETTTDRVAANRTAAV